MTKTRENILEKALELFNTYGWEYVSIRQIAKELGISHGNLCYHYANTDALAEALYFQMVAEIEQSSPGVAHSFHQLLRSEKASFSIRYKYKFFVLNFSDLMTRKPKIRSHYTEFQKLREKHFKQQFNALQEEGICKPNIPDVLLENLMLSYFIMGDLWIAHAEMCYTGKASEKIEYHLFHTINSIWPYLTAKGMELYKQQSLIATYLNH
jgi:AcrR family transcriptional regulator